MELVGYELYLKTQSLPFDLSYTCYEKAKE